MALVALCKRLQDQRPETYSFIAIIVNHQARLESRVEADYVRDLVHGIGKSAWSFVRAQSFATDSPDKGLKATVRTATWPDATTEKLELGNFESQARTLRFQELGLECKQQGLRYLLLGHHADDQAETVLGRIISGKTGPGLRGMKPSARIPECQGMWGISEGPERRRFKANPYGGTIHATHPSVLKARADSKSWGSAITSGYTAHTARPGITIHRPLLGFSKAQLKETCQQWGVTWKEDQTNEDVKLTMRNAVRALLRKRALPAALRGSRMLQLQGSVRHKEEELNQSTNALFDMLDIRYFDPRTGSMELVLVPQQFASSKDNEQPGNVGLEAREGIKRMTKRLVQSISPEPTVDHRKCTSAADKWVDAILNEDIPSTFTGVGVQWHRLRESSSHSAQAWLLTRQGPPRRRPRANERPDSCAWSIDGDPKVGSTAKPFGTWQLYDHRFWIATASGHYRSVSTRLLRRQDYEEMRSRFGSNPWLKTFNQRSKHHILKATIPCLQESVSGRVLALPTLGMTVPEADGKLSWKTCYRAIDLGAHARRLLQHG